MSENLHQQTKADLEGEARARDLRQKIAGRGWTLAQFGREAGLSRNDVYRLAKGQKPNAKQSEILAAVFTKA